MLVAGFVPLPYVLYSIVQTLRKRPQANFVGVLLAYLAVLIPVGVFAWGTARQNQRAQPGKCWPQRPLIHHLMPQQPDPCCPVRPSPARRRGNLFQQSRR